HSPADQILLLERGARFLLREALRPLLRAGPRRLAERLMRRRPRSKRFRDNVKALLIVAAFCFLVFVWTQNTFDNFLWHIGLNHSQCATNGFGATFCGDDLARYEQMTGQDR